MKLASARYEHCVITGASSGIGQEFATQLARRARVLTLVARRGERLAQLSDHLTSLHGVSCRVLVCDLASLEGPRQLLADLATPGVPAVDLLVNNAGFGRHGAFVDDPWSTQEQMMLLNAVTPTHLVHGLWDTLAAAPGRGVIHVVSTAAFQPIPWFATYGATKAFLRSWSLGVGAEARARGIRMLALCPGPVPTEFGEVADARWSVAKWKTSPERVVRVALGAYDAGRRQVVPGMVNRVIARLVQWLPSSVVIAGAAALARRERA